MLELLVQDYLKSKSLADLEKDHGVKARVAEHKFSLNYDQIEAEEADKLAQQCRGLILAPESGLVALDEPLGATKVLCWPFHRFFNHGQAAAAKVDLAHPETAFYEKMDGTLCNLYYDFVKGEWHVATRSIPEANLPIDGFGDYTFRTLFEKGLKETTGLDFGEFVNKLKVNHTYMWELTTPLNRIVVEYTDYRVTLLGARSHEDGKEYDVQAVAKDLNVPYPERYRFGNIMELVDFVSQRDPQAHEGIVVCDTNFRRIKVKNPGYLALNRVRDSVMNSPRGLVELILLEKLDDAMSLFPENIQERAISLQAAFREYLHKHDALYEECLHEANEKAPIFNENSDSLKRDHRKMFALTVQERKGWMAPMMEQYQGRVSSFRDWISKKRQPDGGWSNGFLDNLIKVLEK